MGYKENIPPTAILRRITGLSKVNFKSRPGKFSVSAEAHRRKDREIDGTFIEDFDQDVIPGAVTVLTPYWNDLKDTYWQDSRENLNELVEKLRLKFPIGHRNAGKIIEPLDVDPDDYWDAFFHHDALKVKRMEGGKYLMEMHKDPLDALLYFSYLHNPRVLVKGFKGEVSKYTIGTALYELIIPQQETVDQREVLKKEMDAMTKLGSASYDKQKLIAHAMKLRLTNNVTPNPDDLIVKLGKAVKDDKVARKWGKSPRDKFLELFDLDNTDLMITVDIIKGEDYRLITSERGKYLFNQEIIDGITDENQLFNYFKKNEEKYNDLVFLIGEKEKHTA